MFICENTQTPLRFLAFSLVEAIFLAAPATPAHAATWYQIKNTYATTCLTEDGTTGALYLQTCATGTNINHSQLWYEGTFASLVNVHSGYCRIVTGDEPGVWLTGGTACTTPTSVADWTFNINTGGHVLNDHTGWYFDNDVEGSCGLCQIPYDLLGDNWQFVKAN